MWTRWKEDRALCKKEGVYIGNYNFGGVLCPTKIDGHHGKRDFGHHDYVINQFEDTAEDSIERINTAEPDWTKEEERKLLLKIDSRVLFPCCVIYFLA